MPKIPLSSSSPSPGVNSDDWSALRAGILLGGAYKLVSRVPRWVARRRFKARSLDSDEDVSLFFFALDSDELARWKNECRTLVPFADPNLFPVSRVEEFQQYHFVVGDWVEGEDLEMFLMENGPLEAAQAREIFQSVLASARRLFFAGLPVPPLDPSRILLTQRDGKTIPLLFPLRESSDPALSDEASICRGLRDLLFSLLTGLEPRRTYNERILQLLPRSISAVWEPIFLEDPDFDLLREHVDMALPLRAAPPIVPTPSRPSRSQPEPFEPEESAPNFRKPPSRSSLPPSGMELPIRRRQNRPPPAPPKNALNFIALGIALLAPLLLGWAAWHFIFERPHTEPQPISLQDLDPHVGLPPIPGGAKPSPLTTPLEGSTPRSNPSPSPAPGPPPQASSASRPGTSPIPQQQATALPTEPSARLRNLSQELLNDPQSVDLLRDLDQLLAEFSRQEAEIRAGRNEALFQALEETQSLRPEIALLFARILWGRDTPRAEAIYIELAQKGNETAREICRQRLLNWQTSPGANPQ